ncbi:hypothetical protein [Thalassoglobus polymorphus]|uniref:Zinc-ribbon domain-containing protein n=1 Tax=Thalassoglobus polymorphus TaxID=2527994 RepID=A0A517QSB5_9PLAN|nr:hypothetical protein [Thalassoglobus polymorphus]QDT34526.1 hypothetical protein Mal48_37880 [Thalassoglobus polymorphus]
MFCSECGVEASGKFCFNCGNRLHGVEPGETGQTVAPVASDVDWRNEVQCEKILLVEEVRSVIAGHAKRASKGLSGEECLSIYDNIVSSPVPLAKLATIVQPFYAARGIRTGKERAGQVSAPVGVVIARALCSLAKHGQTFETVEQAEDACTLIAELPSSILALKGEIRITVTRQQGPTRVAALTNIPGQWFDWGKCRNCLDQLFLDLRSTMGLPVKQRKDAA